MQLFSPIVAVGASDSEGLVEGGPGITGLSVGLPLFVGASDNEGLVEGGSGITGLFVGLTLTVGTSDSEGLVEVVPTVGGELL